MASLQSRLEAGASRGSPEGCLPAAGAICSGLLPPVVAGGGTGRAQVLILLHFECRASNASQITPSLP